MKRTLKRELKVLETAKSQGIRTVGSGRFLTSTCSLEEFNCGNLSFLRSGTLFYSNLESVLGKGGASSVRMDLFRGI